MNLYLAVFLLLALAVIVEWLRPQYQETLYKLCWIMVTACLCFRFGQGTDYVTYHAIYHTIPVAFDFSQGYICGFYPEIGWRLLSAFFKCLGLPFWVFSMTLGFVNMVLLNRFLKRNVPAKTAGLFLCYPVLFLVYMVSGLRQGLALCLFLGLAFPFYLEKKWVPYVLTVLLAASFHKVGFAWLILMIVYYLSVKLLMVFLGLSFVGGLVLQIGFVEQVFVKLLPSYHISQFLLEGKPSLFALGERCVSFAILFGLAIYWKKKRGQLEKVAELTLKAYTCNLCFYFLLMGNAYYASRYGVIFKVLECALLLPFLTERDKITNWAACFFFGLTLVMGLKNMNAMIIEGGYQQFGIQLWNYPYISVFDQDAIDSYFDYDKRLEFLYQNNIEDQELWRIGQ